MNESWEKLGIEIHNLKETLEELLEMVPQSPKFYTITNNINKQWKKIQKAVGDMDQFITPAKSVKVNSPLLASEAFKETWQFWKDYLVEQHGIFMRSRAELSALKRLNEISGENPETASRYLKFAMSRIEKNFYKVNETEPQAPSVKSGEKQNALVIKLPKKYSTEKP